jgi:hypothetical protein
VVRRLILAITLAFAALGESAVTLEGRDSAAASISRLTPCGRALCREDGQRFRWRGVTAFALLDLLADGKEPEARAYLEWARHAKFTIVRVLAMNPKGWFDLEPTDGRRALPALLRLARDHQLYVQIVALANTAGRSDGYLREQVREVGHLCAAADNCVLEVANEPYHRSQAKLHDAALMRRLQQEVPKGVVAAWGAAPVHSSDSMAGGAYVVAHVARSGDRWARVDRMRDLQRLSKRTGRFVVDNEPIGAAERAERNRRDTEPAAFFAQGVLSRLLELGSTFHCEDCLRAQVPRPTQQACAKAFIGGATLMPDDLVLAHIDGAATDVPVREPVDGGGRHAIAAVAGDRGWLALLGVGRSGDVSWNGPWRPDKRVADWPGVEVWTFARGGPAQK